MRRFIPALGLVLLAGCYNGDVNNIRLGDVSLGQQLIDLKSALDGGAMSQTEYDAAKASLLALSTACGSLESSDDPAAESAED